MAHSDAPDFFADDVEEGDVVWGNLGGGDEGVDCEDLGGDAAFGVYGAAAENCGVFGVVVGGGGVFVGEEGGDLD